MKDYQWLLFDADETLFDFDSFRGLQHMFKQLNVEFNDTDFQAYEAVNFPLWQQYQQQLITMEQLKVARFSHWQSVTGIDALELNQKFLDSMAITSQPLPGARTLLNTLNQAGCGVAIITNGMAELQGKRLANTGFDKLVDVLVVSEEVGTAKPDVRIFEHTFEKINYFDRGRMLMVGDNLHTDILGGNNAGIDTCWLNFREKPSVRDIKPTIEVASLSELQQWLMTQTVSVR